MGKHHIMLSYQWNKQDLVEKVYHGLREHGIDAWMDTHGGVTGNINDRCACAKHETCIYLLPHVCLFCFTI